MTDEPFKLGDFNLSGVTVMHMLHTLDSKPADVSSTVRLGFKWAEIGEGAGLFLCVCEDRCENAELCGRAFFENMERADQDAGKKVRVEMPWNDDGEPLTFEVWCCRVCEVEGTGAVFDTWVGRFFDIPARLLQYEHEERSRSYLGLRESMGKAYPDEFAESSYVTLVLYRRTT